MRSNDLLDKFIKHLRAERCLSPRTWESYGYQIKGYLRFLELEGRDTSASSIDFVTAYMEGLKKRKLKGSSLFAAAIAIREFHRFLHRRGYLPSDRTTGMHLPKFRQRLPTILSADDMAKFLDLLPGSKFQQIRFRAMMELLYATGLRVSELIAVKMDRINFEERWVRVLGKGSKERIVPFSPKAKESLVCYLDARRNRFPLAQDTLFLNSRGQGLTRGGFWWELKRFAKQAGVSQRISPHCIRHSAASHLLAGGADIRILQEFLGHESILTTQRYTHVNFQLLQTVCKKSHPRFSE